MPEISRKLFKLVTCFTLCESQVRISDSGFIYGLDYMVVIRVAESMCIEVNETFYRYLKTFENVFIKERNSETSRRNKSSSGTMK